MLQLCVDSQGNYFQRDSVNESFKFDRKILEDQLHCFAYTPRFIRKKFRFSKLLSLPLLLSTGLVSDR